MKISLENKTTLKLLELLCTGEGVNINISALSKELKKHRNTLKDRVNQLIDHKIVEKPFYPLLWMFNEYPLLVISKDKLQRDEKTKALIEKDPHIFAGYFFQEEAYNTLTIQFHKDLYSYHTWSDNILENEKIIKEEDRYPPNALLFSTKRILKFDTTAPFRIIERGFKKGRIKEIGNLKLDSLSVNILKLILNGKSIRTNENSLARTLNVTRSTVIRQIQGLLQEGIIGKPISRFPLTFVPPDYMLIFSLYEIKKRCKEVEGFFRRDHRVPLLIKANTGRYNYFVASTFKTVEDHIKWQEKHTQNFNVCIKAIKNTYLSPAMTFSINQNSIAQELIKKKLRLLKEKEHTFENDMDL